MDRGPDRATQIVIDAAHRRGFVCGHTAVADGAYAAAHRLERRHADLSGLGVARGHPGGCGYDAGARATLRSRPGYIIFLLVVVASAASVVAIGFIVGDARLLPFPERAGRLSLSILALLLSWLLIQTLFAFHYARCYYWREDPAKDHIRGLRFPGETSPITSISPITRSWWG